MPRTVSIGRQNFEKIRKHGNFYVDKTRFIREWWEADDEVTLITRPRRFGKTLNMSMIECFFSARYENMGSLFDGLEIWMEERFRKLQGTYPVISLSFAAIKEKDFFTARRKICQTLANLYSQNGFLMEQGILDDRERSFFESVSVDMDDVAATFAIHQLAGFLSRFYGNKAIILLDEYDTPMQEAYVNGYWDEMTFFTRSLFNATFKTNPHMERAIMTGITRVSRESIFSDLNNLKIVTTTSREYADSFGFTEEEVFAALKEYGFYDQREVIRQWYDGFTFGDQTDIYNPWSIINYLDTGKLDTYWANSSSNRLAGKLIREGSRRIKQEFEDLMRGKALRLELDEQIVYDQLPVQRNAIWSLLLASGYLKVVKTERPEQSGRRSYSLVLTNREVRIMFEDMIHGWFAEAGNDRYNDFIQALLSADLKAMNYYMNKVAMVTFSYFDTGNHPSESEPERFYHGFVLGLMVDLGDRYILTSNRESGFGRYDVMLEPKNLQEDGIIIEFKVQDKDEGEKELSDTVQAALRQIDRQKYEELLVAKGLPRERIRKYGFAFCGKKVLIGR